MLSIRMALRSAIVYATILCVRGMAQLSVISDLELSCLLSLFFYEKKIIMWHFATDAMFTLRD